MNNSVQLLTLPHPSQTARGIILPPFVHATSKRKRYKQPATKRQALMSALFGRSLVAYNMNSFRPLSHIETLALEVKVNPFCSFVAFAAPKLRHILFMPLLPSAMGTK